MATTLTVWKFEGPETAQKALELLLGLGRERLIEVTDAATVSWPADANKPTTRHLYDLTSTGALDGAFWGMLLGLIFFMPFLGMAIGALSGAISGHFAQYGIGDDFIQTIRTKVKPGTSALFLLTGQVTVDKVAAAAKEAGLQGELIQSNLSNADEEKLKHMYGH